MSLYAATKRANELMAHSYSSLFALPTTGLRFFTVYGPWGRPDMALFLFARAILEGKPIEVFNHGHHKRDFTYIDDIVEGVVRVLDRVAQPDPHWDSAQPDPASSRAPYRIYNIGSNRPIDLLRYIEVLEECLGRKVEKDHAADAAGRCGGYLCRRARLIEDVGYSPPRRSRWGCAISSPGTATTTALRAGRYRAGPWRRGAPFRSNAAWRP